MAIHIIPEHEPELHIKQQDCTCEPELKIDEESGEMVWIHNILNWEKLFVDFMKS